MSNQWRICLNTKKVPDKIGIEYTMNGKLGEIKGKTAFFYISTEEGTERLFMNALADSEPEHALAYMSKAAGRSFSVNDINELIDFFEEPREYKILTKAEHGEKTSKNCITKSLLVINKERKNSIIHLHMVREPDKYSKWKIYSIEKE